MITVICGTNRPESYSSKVAKFYCKTLDAKNIPFQYFSMEKMPQDLLNSEMYGTNIHPELELIQDEVLRKASKFIFVIPEYNGSFPGVLKAFIDVSDIVGCWHNKKACIVGIASGRAGNLRGMDHLTNILNHMKINVLHLKVPISGVESVFKDDEISNSELLGLIDKQIDLLVDF